MSYACHVYINVCSFHWILLNIHMQRGVIDVYDSMENKVVKYEKLTKAVEK
jgi:Ulp1 family protease